MNFDTAFETLIGHEGGYVNHPTDPGGETKFGISKRAYPAVDIPTLTLERAKEIYRRDYWDRVKGDALPYAVAFNVFDMAVNSGVSPAIKAMQNALGVTADGVIGPVTVGKAMAMDPVRFAVRFNAARLQFYTELPTWSTFGKGWARRIVSNLKELA